MQHMQRRTLLLMLGSGALGACAPQPYTNPLSREARAALGITRIEVVTTGTAFESALAAESATRLGPDLTGALRQEFADRMRPDGVVMSVELARLNMASSLRTAFGRDQSRLQGTVRLLDASGRLLAAYPVQVEAGAAAATRTGALARASVTTAEGFYRDLLRAFARAAREQILGAGIPGQRLLRRVTSG
ncbi:hypothetical protein [Pararhodobacter sp. SW119]|uniref:hypothetical protein n=1 Tax=Pararhodobacter sp. SW119 TaxID=2780075 RepID=UPI001ADF5B61|nr:hypothetical protein [Pararhodobacter sp. SW119]